MKSNYQKSIIKIQEPENLRLFIIIVMAVVTFILFSLIIGSNYFSFMNLQTIAYELPEFGFLSLAMSLCMLTGGIDLSVVSISTLSSIVASYVLINMSKNGGNVIVAILSAIIVALVISSVCGLINGLLISKASVLPILATLATMILYNGIAMALSNGAGVVGYPFAFINLGLMDIFGIPLILLFFILALVILALVLKYTLYGKNVYLYGNNKTASLFSGINNDAVVIKTYILSGLFCGIAGLIIMSRVNSARVGYGSTYLLQAILVCVLGGISPKGGKGKIMGMFLGIITLQMLQSGFTLLSFPPYVNSLIWGLVLVITMIIDFYINKNHNKIKHKLSAT